jgi:hypothetical protein
MYEYPDRVDSIMDELFVLQTKITSLRTFTELQFRSLDLKKAKRNRTQKNKCQYVSERKGRPCAGYICRKSRSLCYAHHLLAVTPEGQSSLFENKPPLTEDEVVDILMRGTAPTLMSVEAVDAR